MNHIYRLVRSRITGVTIAVAENTKCRSVGVSRGRRVHPIAIVLLSSAASVAHAAPTGGSVAAGNASIATTGSDTTINQASQSAVLNWQSFDIAAHESVRFVQPNTSSIALNRVLGPDATQIMGNLSSNGKLFLINPNGVLFGKGAQVNVGGLVASTRNISDVDFLSGRFMFSGSSDATVANYGSIESNGGYVALLGAHVSNQGLITARLGSIALASGDAFTLDTAGDGLLNVTVNAGALRSLVENGGLLRADGGQVVMTARSASALVQSVVNNTGVVQAQTIENRNGVIKLLGDMESGVVNVGGRLDASAPDGGDGGFVETSASHVAIAPDARVTTLASEGVTGNWLIDPVDFTIASSGGDTTGAQLSTNLAGGNITILSGSGASGVNGDIHVNDTVTWSANKLTLNAHNNININTAMFGSGTASLALLYGQGAVAAGNTSTVNVHAAVNLAAGNNFSTQLGSNGALVNYTVITDLGAAGSTTGTDLQGISGNLAGNYVLGSDINAIATSAWNSGAGFAPIGTDPSRFTGNFDGLGHAVSDLYINSTGSNFIGLFGYTATGSTVQNVGMLGGSVTSSEWSTGSLVGALGGSLLNSYATTSVNGFQTVGGLVGVIDGGLISDSHASGTVVSNGNGEVGGLVGLSWGPGGGTTRNSYATGDVSSTVGNVGGLMGINWGTIINSYATGTATGTDYVGGLVGNNSNGTTTGSYATGAVSGNDYVGGLVGNNSNSVTNSYATGAVNGGGAVGGVAGMNSGTFTNNYATGNVTAGNFAGGLIGSNWGTVSGSYAKGNVTAGDQVAGLVGGHNSGSISYSYATGTVNATTGAAGGLVGYSAAPISTSYATGDVTGVNQVGGILGAMNGSTVTDSYATGNVTGTSSVGGAVGNSSNGTITRVYSSGAVIGTTSVGGLLGSSTSATVNNSYWDLTTSGQASSAGGTGLTTTQMLTASNFTGFNFTTTPGATGNNWVMVNANGTLNGAGNISGGTRPMLASEYSTTLTNAHQLQLVRMNLSANYTLANNIELAAELANSSGLWHAGSAGFAPIGVYNGTFDGLGHTINGLLINRPADTYVGLFGAVSATATVRNVGLIGGNVTGNVYVGSLAGRNEGVITNSFATTDVNGSLSAGGLVGAVFPTGTLTNSYATGAVSSQYAGGLVGLNQGTIDNSYATGATTGSSSGGFAGRNVGGTITSSYSMGAVSGTGSGGFTSLNTSTITASFWNTTTSGKATSAAGTGLTTSQLQASLPTGLSSSTWGNATNQTTPYLLTNAGPVLIATDASGTYYNPILTLNQLQNINANPTLNYALVNNIDASATNGWNGGQGFVPIGNASTQFTGSFDGLGHIISNLTINRPTTDYVGLFGYAAGANVNRLGLVNVNITGQDAVGALYGATVVGGSTHNFATGQVAGRFSVGGLIGYNNTSALNSSYSAANVTGTDKVGGLMGETNGGIASTFNYATGNVTASGDYVGGLVGYNGFAFFISDSYAAGNVSGVSAVGGLVGYHLNGGISASYSTGSVVGTSSLGGLIGFTDTGTVSNSYWNTTTSGHATSSGGTGLTNSQMQTAASITGFDLNTNWIVYEGHTAPLLRVFMTPLTVTAANVTKTYDGAAYDGSGGVTYSTTPNMSNVLGTIAYASGINAGSHAITPSGLYSNQLGYLISYSPGTLTVNPAALTAVANASNRSYDGTTAASATLGSFSGLIGTETIGATTTATFNTKDVATASLVTVNSVTLADGTNGGLASNYTLVSGQTASANITPRALTATASATNKVYDGTTTANATLNSITGLVGTETIGASAMSAFNTKDVATASLVTVNGISLSNGTNGGLATNYSLATGQTASASITPQALTASASATDKVYDGTITASATLGSLTGLIGTETINTSNTATFNTKDVATANLVTVGGVTLADGTNGGLASNYSLASGQTASANITSRALTASASATNKVYDGTTTASATLGSLTGLIGTETINISNTATFNTKDVATANLVTVSGVTLSNGSNGELASNYTIAAGQTASASITPRVLTAFASATNKVYDGATTASATLGSLVGLIGTETIGTSATANFNSKDVATANLVTVSGVALSNGSNGGLASNYSLATGQTTNASITPAALGATAVATNKVYDGATAASATLGSLAGLVGIETLNTSATATFNAKDVAAANQVTVNAVTLANGTNGGLASNYSLAAGQTASANITPRTVTASASATNKIYDGTMTANAALGSLTGLVGSETINASAAATFNTKDVATANLVTVNGVTLSNGTNGGLAGNYTLAAGQTAFAMITPRALSATAGAATKIYDGTTGAAATLNGLTGFIGSETIVANVSGQFNSKDVATSNLVTIDTVTLNDGTNGGLASNYSLVTGQTAAANITPRALTVTGESALGKIYDGTVVATMTGGTLIGVIGSDNVSLTRSGLFVTPFVGSDIPVTSASVLGGTDATNYLLVQPTGLSADIHAVTNAANLPNGVSPVAAYESARGAVSAASGSTIDSSTQPLWISSSEPQTTTSSDGAARSGPVTTPRHFDDLNLTIIGAGLNTSAEWSVGESDEDKR